MKKALLLAALMMVATLGMTQTVSIGGLNYTLSSSTWTATVTTSVTMYNNVIS